MDFFRSSRAGSTDSASGAAGELISGIPLEECGPLGEHVAATAAKHDLLANDPSAREIEAQGAQSVSLTLKALCSSVNSDAAELARLTERRMLFEPILKEATRRVVQSARLLRSFGDELQQVRHRLPLLSNGSPFLVFLVLVAIAVGEFVLNRAAFKITGESAVNVDILAMALGVAQVAAAHEGGKAVRRLADRLSSTLATPALVVASVVPALLIAAGSVAGLRTAFFSESAIDVPSGWLLLLQVFLLWVAVALAIAHSQPLRAESARLAEEVRSDQAKLSELQGRWCELRTAELLAEATMRTTVTKACADMAVQQDHTVRQVQRFASGVQAATGAPASVEPSAVDDLGVLTTWQGWLAAHPIPSATPSVVEELDRLLQEVTVVELGPRPAAEGPSPEPLPRRLRRGRHTATGDGEPSPVAEEPEDPGLSDLAMNEPGPEGRNGRAGAWQI